MLDAMSLVFVVGVCGFSARTAVQMTDEARRCLRVLRREVERFSSGDETSGSSDTYAVVADSYALPLGGRSRGMERDIAQLVGEVFQDGNWLLSQAAAHELLTYHKMLNNRVKGVGRGILRVPFLSAVAVAIFLTASLGLERSTLLRVLVAIGLGLLTTVVCQLYLMKARSLVRAFGSLCELLDRELPKERQEGGMDVRKGITA